MGVLLLYHIDLEVESMGHQVCLTSILLDITKLLPQMIILINPLTSSV